LKKRGAPARPSRSTSATASYPARRPAPRGPRAATLRAGTRRPRRHGARQRMLSLFFAMLPQSGPRQHGRVSLNRARRGAQFKTDP
jgi:hypothetical protein